MRLLRPWWYDSWVCGNPQPPPSSFGQCLVTSQSWNTFDNATWWLVGGPLDIVLLGRLFFSTRKIFRPCELPPPGTSVTFGGLLVLFTCAGIDRTTRNPGLSIWNHSSSIWIFCTVRDYMCLVFDKLFFFASFSRNLGVRNFFEPSNLEKSKSKHKMI